jgi:AraC family transcriptional regulator, glycine betaine-responsive activator
VICRAQAGFNEVKICSLLLLQTDISVINVALASGFSSLSHFSKCYRAFYGRTLYRERGIPVIQAVA